MARLLITRGAGFIRANFVQYIRDTPLVERLLQEERIDTIVHFPAESHVDRSIEGPDAFIETNIIGTHSMLKAARTVWLEQQSVPVHRFHHVSTDESMVRLVRMMRHLRK
jgi:dTDP-D-glucose 4,6-dehydratase